MNMLVESFPSGFCIEQDEKGYLVKYDGKIPARLYEIENYFQAVLAVNLLEALPVFWSDYKHGHAHTVLADNAAFIWSRLDEAERVKSFSGLKLLSAAKPVTAYHFDGTPFQTFIGKTKGDFSLVLSDKLAGNLKPHNTYSIVTTATMQVVGNEKFNLDNIGLIRGMYILGGVDIYTAFIHTAYAFNSTYDPIYQIVKYMERPFSLG